MYEEQRQAQIGILIPELSLRQEQSQNKLNKGADRW